MSEDLRKLIGVAVMAKKLEVGNNGIATSLRTDGS